MYVSKLTIIGSDNGLSPAWRQAIIWTNASIMLIGHMGIQFNEILIDIARFHSKNAFQNVVGKMTAIFFCLTC